MVNIDIEEKLFIERIENGFYTVDRAKNTGNDYVDSGRLDRDIEAVDDYTHSAEFDVIRNLRWLHGELHGMVSRY